MLYISQYFPQLFNLVQNTSSRGSASRCPCLDACLEIKNLEHIFLKYHAQTSQILNTQLVNSAPLLLCQRNCLSRNMVRLPKRNSPPNQIICQICCKHFCSQSFPHFLRVDGKC